MTTITFKKACKIVQKATACIIDGNALSYPVVNEDFNGNDCIEVNWQGENGMHENTFTSEATYSIDDNGCLVIDEDGSQYFLQFLKLTKVK